MSIIKLLMAGPMIVVGIALISVARLFILARHVLLVWVLLAILYKFAE